MAGRFIVVLFGFIFFENTAFGFREFQTKIPNGAQIPSPCNQTQFWPGVGHEISEGSGRLNEFGKLFAENGNQWTMAVCLADSDGDGRTNGEELGDPSCIWSPGSEPEVTNPNKLSHPGICEPVESVLCRKQANWPSSGPNSTTTFDQCGRQIIDISKSAWCPGVMQPDVSFLDIRFFETVFTVSAENSYFCQKFRLPEYQDYHIIAWEPIISNLFAVHHMFLFICDTVAAEEKTETSDDQYLLPSKCGAVPSQCPSTNIGWSFGMEGRCFGEAAGLAMGKGSYSTVILQIHYNKNEGTFADSSGIRIYYTPRKRPFTLAYVRLGQVDIAIPPQSPMTTISGRAFQSKNCSFQQLANYRNWPQQVTANYTIMAMYFHMHKAGRYAKVTLERQNGEKIILFDQEYRYNGLITKSWELSQMVTFASGDNFITECTYNTLDRTDWTFYGKNLDQEMCFAALEVYPRPRGANFIELSSYSLLDSCTISEYKMTKPPFCEESVLYAIISSIKNDETGGLVEHCNESVSTTCCQFLAKHDFLAYQCVYESSFQIVTQVIKEDGFLVNTVHQAILKCISALQTTTLEQLNHDGAAKTSHKQAADGSERETKQSQNSKIPAIIMPTPPEKATLKSSSDGRLSSLMNKNTSFMMLVIAIKTVTLQSDAISH